MNNIVENAKFEMENVISYRSEITQQDAVHIIKEMNSIITDSLAKKNGFTVTATYNVISYDKNPIVDMEILIPLDKKISVPSNYIFKPTFRLNNAVKMQYKGHPAKLEENVKKFMEYISERKLTPITPSYNVTVYEPKNRDDLENYAVDMYIGVSDNIL